MYLYTVVAAVSPCVYINVCLHCGRRAACTPHDKTATRSHTAATIRWRCVRFAFPLRKRKAQNFYVYLVAVDYNACSGGRRNTCKKKKKKNHTLVCIYMLHIHRGMTVDGTNLVSKFCNKVRFFPPRAPVKLSKRGPIT